MYHCVYESPIGKILLQSTNDALIRLDFIEENILKGPGNSVLSSILDRTRVELDEYFRGDRQTFTIPILQEGTAFQRSVWKALTTIPYGVTKSYEDIAVQIGNPKSVRAVGLTNSRNPISIIVPCHRVIGKNGNMVGYASGVWRKEWLLAHERKIIS